MLISQVVQCGVGGLPAPHWLGAQGRVGARVGVFRCGLLRSRRRACTRRACAVVGVALELGVFGAAKRRLQRLLAGGSPHYGGCFCPGPSHDSVFTR
jgi:hypothetical protein